jgi:hypothetical protein
MGFIDRLKKSFAKPPEPNPEVDRTVNEQLRAFVKETYIGTYVRAREGGKSSEEVARRAMLSSLGTDLGNLKIKKAAITYIAKAARLRLPDPPSSDQEAALEESLLAAAARRFRQDRLIQIMVEEVALLEGRVPAPAQAPRTESEKPPAPQPVPEIAIGGIVFPLARDVETMCRTIDDGGRCVLRLKSLDYGRVLGDLMAALERRYGKGDARAGVIFSASLLCAGCGLEFPGSFRLALQDPGMSSRGMIVTGGAPGRDEFGKTGRCPKCRNAESLLVYEYVDPAKVTAEDVESIRDLWRDLATAWWAAQNRSEAICDYCSGDIPAGKGYLSGSSLICDDCVSKGLMSEGLAKLRSNPDYYGPSLVRKARAAREARKK